MKHTSRKIYYNKLIRDKIPEKIRVSGGDLKTVRLNRRQFEQELLKKAVEESGGLLAAKTTEELVSELADLLAVIEEIRKIKRISDKHVAKALRENMARKGGFKKKLFLVWSSDTGYKTNERTYGKK
jgi:predicted house-cleaning noncanonical NTP pyrophosphatase (MazG superfamily)